MIRTCIVFLLAIQLAGCGVPGMRLDFDKSESERAWFDGDPRDDTSGLQENKPKVQKITSDLLVRLRQQENSATVLISQPPLPDLDKYPEYRLGAGDVLSIIVYGHKDLTNPSGAADSSGVSGQVVNSSGEIYFPFVGTTKVAGLTVTAVRDNIKNELSRVIRDPQVDVRVAEFRSKYMTITGDVNQPCRVPVSDTPLTLGQALTACSIVDEGGGSQAGRGLATKSLRLVRGSKDYRLNLEALYQSNQEIWLLPGDRLVADDSLRRIFLLGEFGTQTATPMPLGGLTLSDAIIEAGGLNLDTADAGHIYIIRGFVDADSAGKGQLQTNPIPLVYYLDGNSPESLILSNYFEMKPRDIVFASAAGLVNFNRALNLLTPMLNLLQTFLLFDRR